MLLNDYSWRKKNVVPTAKSIVCIVVLGDKINDSSSKILPPGIWRAVHQAMVDKIQRDGQCSALEEDRWTFSRC
jgi:hypothetical protein